MEVTAELRRRMSQFLVHSFVYYKLNENIISDHQYDWLCKHLVEVMERHPIEAAALPYYDLCKGIEQSGSGFYIQDYPKEIMTTAFRMMWLNKKQTIPDFHEDFKLFISRWGMVLEG